MSIWGNPIMMGGSSGGGIELMTRTEWDSLTPEEKKTYGLLAIQDSDTGFNRGQLVDGSEYIVFTPVQSGTAASTTTFTIDDAGSYKLYVIALNSEATTRNLNITATQNGTGLAENTISFHEYFSSGENRRNYRFSYFDVTADAGDSIQINLSNVSGYTSFVYVLAASGFTSLKKALSTADAVCSGSYGANGAVLYGTFAGANGGTVTASNYTANTTVTTANPGSNYRSAYIFWIE